MTPSLIDLASLAGGAIDGHVIAALERAGFPGLRTRHGYVVQRLLAGDRTITGIARSLGVTQQAMSKTVAELERMGYVHRDDDPEDARRRSLSLSSRGMAAVDTARAVRLRLLTRVTADVGATRVADAEAVMRAVLDALSLAGRVDDRTMPVPPGSDTDEGSTHGEEQLDGPGSAPGISPR
ncbi:MarR family winged helix-turn-helix transcriptional regulator [Microbacterium sp. CPCC 204701]|uniref:MarR family winged helix-turn-helix transcriptional regulator n=1 Tax=Microbacterium sp. CPCC 204701 TaxID=2493084 RepID=UPI0013E327B5|nr:MarR family transcriptional regulator [Microbacterium sp. CPCC 204701]